MLFLIISIIYLEGNIKKSGEILSLLLFFFFSFSSEYSNSMFLSVFTKALMHIHACHLLHVRAWCPEWNLEGWVHCVILLKPGLASSIEYISTSVVPSLLTPPTSPLKCSALANFCLSKHFSSLWPAFLSTVIAIFSVRRFPGIFMITVSTVIVWYVFYPISYFLHNALNWNIMKH